MPPSARSYYRKIEEFDRLLRKYRGGRIRDCPDLPEIMLDDVLVGRGGSHPLQARIDNPPAGFDGGVVPQIVGGLEHDPGRIHRLVELWLIGIVIEASACRGAECECVHCRSSQLITQTACIV